MSFNPLIHKLCNPLLRHNMGQKLPVLTYNVISCTAECFFAIFLFQHLIFKVFIKYLVFDDHKSLFNATAVVLAIKLFLSWLQ